MLLIITKLAIYVISFVNFPGLFFVPLLVQFVMVLLVLSFTNISPRFRLLTWHDRMIHCLVCCVLPLAVSDDPQWDLKVDNDNSDQEENTVGEKNSPVSGLEMKDMRGNKLEVGGTNEECRDGDGAPSSSDSNTEPELVKNSLKEIMVALFLYTFECFLVTAFAAIIFNYYHFDEYRDFLQEFVEDYFSFLPGMILEEFNEVATLMCFTVFLVVLLSSALIIAYYKWLHPSLHMFPVSPAPDYETQIISERRDPDGVSLSTTIQPANSSETDSSCPHSSGDLSEDSCSVVSREVSGDDIQD